MLGQGDWRKENMSDHYAFDFRNERNQRHTPAAQSFDEICLGRCVERSLVHRTDSCVVSFGFWTNTHTLRTAYNYN